MLESLFRLKCASLRSYSGGCYLVFLGRINAANMSKLLGNLSMSALSQS